MARVISGITISLDGYVTGPGDRLGAGLGEGGERLHEWVFGGPWTYDGPRGTPAAVDQEYLESVFADGGAWIVGRTMHDVVDGWGDDPGFGVPVFVVTHRNRARKSSSRHDRLPPRTTGSTRSPRSSRART